MTTVAVQTDNLTSDTLPPDPGPLHSHLDTSRSPTLPLTVPLTPSLLKTPTLPLFLPQSPPLPMSVTNLPLLRAPAPSLSIKTTFFHPLEPSLPLIPTPRFSLKLSVLGLTFGPLPLRPPPLLPAALTHLLLPPTLPPSGTTPLSPTSNTPLLRCSTLFGVHPAGPS